MSIEGRKHSLEAKHADLEAKIKTLSSHPSVSDFDLSDMKKEKLFIKDELTKLDNQNAA